MQPPFQVGDLIVGDIICARWLAGTDSTYNARIRGFTEAGDEEVPRIAVQWLFSSGGDWDWETPPIPYEWVVQLLRPALQG